MPTLPITEEAFRLKVLEALVQQAERAGASDVHLQMAGKVAQVAFRLDGVMTPTSTLGAEVAERVVGRIKFLAKLKTYQESLPQDGRINQAELGTRSDVRVATYPTITGEKVVLRLFTGLSTPELSQLELPAAGLGQVQNFLDGTGGLLLLTGPAGERENHDHLCVPPLPGGGWGKTHHHH